MVDTHCHLFMEAFQKDLGAVIVSARSHGVELFVNVGIDEATSLKASELAGRFDDVYSTVGLHPHSAHEATDETVVRFARFIDETPKVVAVGEVGLDYAKSPAPPDVQKRVFRQMADLAGQKNLPLVVHSRDAFEDTLGILQESRGRCPALRAVFHCFSYDPPCLAKALEAGFCVSFTGIVTFPNAASMQASAREAPLERLMIETDAPYLAPQPVRGKRNEPAYLGYVAEAIARLKGLDLSRVAEATTRNAREFFGI